MTMRKVRGEYRYYVEFKAGARRFLQRSEDDPRQRYYNRLAALLFLAFSAEAFVNHIGGKKYPEWWEEVERSPFRSKLKLLCVHLGVKLELDKRPFSTILQSMTRRNLLVHSRRDVFEFTVDVPSDETSRDYLFRPTERDRIAEPTFLKKLADDLDSTIDLILKAAHLETEDPEGLGFATSEPV